MSTHKEQKQYFNYLDGKKCSCPYCHATFIWPPQQLACPECKRTMRPPIGYSSGNSPENKEQILKRIERDRERKLQKLGPRWNFRPGKSPKFLFGVIFLFLILGTAVVSQANKATPKNQPSRETLTNQDLEVLAQALVHYKIDVGEFPLAHKDGGLSALVTVPPDAKNWNGPYINGLHMDGWGRPYFYEIVDGKPRLLSRGPDRRLKTEDDISIDVMSVEPHPDFIPFDPETNDRPIPMSRLRISIGN